MAKLKAILHHSQLDFIISNNKIITRTHPRNRGHIQLVNCCRMNFCKRYYDWRISYIWYQQPFPFFPKSVMCFLSVKFNYFSCFWLYTTIILPLCYNAYFGKSQIKVIKNLKSKKIMHTFFFITQWIVFIIKLMYIYFFLKKNLEFIYIKKKFTLF